MSAREAARSAHVVPAAAMGRRPLHLRRITVEGFARSDGLIDIEGTLIDTKPYDVVLREKTLARNQAVHHMTLRIAVDATLTIVEAEAHTVAAPHAVCGDIADAYRRIVGLTIGPGFNLVVKRMFQKTLGCTHLTELLPAMATTVFQIAWAPPEASRPPAATATTGEAGGRSPLGGCHALRLDGEIARKHFPEVVARLGAIAIVADDAAPSP